MTDDELTIERVLEPSNEHVAAFRRLLPQLSRATPPDVDGLRRITAAAGTYLYVARLKDELVGSLTLVTFAIPTGLRAWIEDVVVDESVRGKGIASALVREAVSQAESLGATGVDLTSRPSRTEANRLYQRLGFSLRETNVYRFDLEN